MDNVDNFTTFADRTVTLKQASFIMREKNYLFGLLTIIFVATVCVGLSSCVDDDDDEVETNYNPCPDDHHPHMIDLGLRSGTKWACCNVGATTPEGTGGYYAWGETEENDGYDWKSYKFWTDQNGNGKVDYDEIADLGSDIAGTSYDVAHVKWGGSWVMPSFDQIEELAKKCTHVWTVRNGTKGMTFIGPNGNTIFLPAAGGRWGGILNNADHNGYAWSSSKGFSVMDGACCLCFDIGNVYCIDGNYRSYSVGVRPVSK